VLAFPISMIVDKFTQSALQVGVRVRSSVLTGQESQRNMDVAEPDECYCSAHAVGTGAGATAASPNDQNQVRRRRWIH
jgi:hypothetical protein